MVVGNALETRHESAGRLARCAPRRSRALPVFGRSMVKRSSLRHRSRMLAGVGCAVLLVSPMSQAQSLSEETAPEVVETGSGVATDVPPPPEPLGATPLQESEVAPESSDVPSRTNALESAPGPAETAEVFEPALGDQFVVRSSVEAEPAPVAQAMRTQGSSASEARAKPHWWVAGEAFASFLSAAIDREKLILSGGYGALAGRRYDDLGLVFQLENVWWSEALLDEESDDVFRGVPQGALAVAIGIERIFANNRMRFMATAGPTVLLRNTLLDSAGTVGFWFDVRVAGIRLTTPASKVRVVVDPLSLTTLLPDLSGIPLVLFHFRSTVTVEFELLGGSG